ncbi:MAG: Histidine biosynthesis bifunctional protein HisB [Chlamydiales bacterium]|nr:Histidine biosynthesis bifunctional protein HisB [Chlamydiales bacterium]MCH9619491.1 Histidine biosynthesis bifunctional protein HisB [Chlamydiales bacterium]MCH9622295.1 Histidine biosynthesis bifunctional protein HisB [Chlamydiales bacterium]
MGKSSAIFLDRDGVINRAVVREGKPYPPSSFSEFEILFGVKEALLKLHKKGFLLIIVTNQPDVGRGWQSKEVVEQMHTYLKEQLPIDGIEVCYDETSERYKPKPGMLIDASVKYGIDLSQSYMIGDRWRDIGAGCCAGCRTIFLEKHYQESLKEVPDITVNDLLEATEVILDESLCRWSHSP